MTPEPTPERKPSSPSPLRRIAAAALAALLLTSACAPASAQLLGGSEEAVGAQEHPKILAQFGGAYPDPRLQAYITEIGNRLAAQTGRSGPWTFTVLDSDVVNAFALPGGYVYVTRGLLALAEDEAEVAGVLGHEIGHVIAHHGRERQTNQTIAGLLAAGIGLVLGSPELAQIANIGGTALLARYSRGQETEADRLGIDYLHRAGYDPFAMATFLETMRRDTQYSGLRSGKGPGEGSGEGGFDFFATHPQTASRVEEAAAIARGLPGGARPVDPYMAAMDGVIYGDSPENGFVRGRTFAHPQLGIAFDVPQGFSLLNGAEQVIAKGPNGGAIVFDGGKAAGTRDPAAYLTGTWAQGAPLQGLQSFTVNGMPAATALTQGKTDAGAVDVRLVAIRADSGTLFRFTFLAPGGALSRFDADFRQTAGSFRRLSRQEAASFQPRRIRVLTARPGDSVEGFVRQMPQEPYAEELFRIINDLPPGTPIQPGRRVKIVAG
ncbi:M48 family metalloprotease [Azospirillum isscasi]|uniref:M48 family metalloprotease n=1 Tax=Azospirillum isscasi TaxID=3053926 RepID=A0ABU0WL54_9PROT|nr:M48 family metalloprotease [Azospirillum isscasi]MDQ2104961.1 M48 family metalloprotease [Azospirillum isscasi]